MADAIAPFRARLMPKIWFFTYNCGAVYFLPYINLFYRHLGFSEAQIGILCALKPWVSAPAGNIVVSLADSWRAHVAVVVATYLVCLLGRGLIAVTTGYGVQVFLALLTEAAAAPMGAVVDAALMAASTDEGSYGRQRMWASVGWGGMSPVAGAVVSGFGLKTAFAIYFIVVSLAFIPTCLLPIGILSQPKSQGSQAGHASQAASLEGNEINQGGDAMGGTSSEIVAVPNRGSGGGTAGKFLTHESYLVARNGSKHNLPSTEPAKMTSSQRGAGGLEHQWSISARSEQQEQGEQPEDAALRYGVLHLTAGARTTTEQVKEMEGGQAHLGVGATKRALEPEAGSIVDRPPAPQDKATISNGATSRRKASCCSECAEGHTSRCCNEEAHGTVLQGLKCMLGDFKVVNFFFLSFCMGVANGSIGYLFLFLDELGASGTLLGMCLSFNCMAEVPVFYYSGQIIGKLGVERAFNLAMAGYVLRLCAYIVLPLLPNVWWVLPVELLQGLTFALAWSSGCVYVKRIAPVWLRSTTQSIFQGLYAGIGAGLGGLVGGFLYGLFGADVVFKTAALTMLAGLGTSILGGRLVVQHDQRHYQGYNQVVGEAEEESGS